MVSKGIGKRGVEVIAVEILVFIKEFTFLASFRQVFRSDW